MQTAIIPSITFLKHDYSHLRFTWKKNQKLQNIFLHIRCLFCVAKTTHHYVIKRGTAIIVMKIPITHLSFNLSTLNDETRNHIIPFHSNAFDLQLQFVSTPTHISRFGCRLSKEEDDRYLWGWGRSRMSDPSRINDARGFMERKEPIPGPHNRPWAAHGPHPVCNLYGLAAVPANRMFQCSDTSD
ncbi:hypothetical protein CEXT_240811 [Caerostris extrusa]|uniref:Uncharacterized protein n=1 Tax=Caerostris extrusa TaxID=172846 RepID=A0AAV4XEU6_CAEEX|nr:hypothetical protein CEXT_240811 [Caerostris extrusa]